MKKLLIISITLILLTGCGNKITCKTNGGKITEEYTVKYKNNEIIKLTTQKTYKFDTKEQFEKFESIVQYNVKAGTANNITSKYKKKNKKYILIQDYNIEKMTDEELEGYSLNKSKTEFINNLKDSGLTCK